MDIFLNLHKKSIRYVINMFDRIIFKGYLSSFFPKGAFQRYLNKRGVLLKDAKVFFEAETARIKQHAEQTAEKQGRPFIYLNSAHTHKGKGGAKKDSKEDLALSIAKRDGVTTGLVCIFSVLETCMSFTVKGNHETHKLETVRKKTKCLHLYWYYIDPVFGWMHIRIQTWAPYSMQIYINGREWLSRELTKRGIGYERSDNKILWVSDHKKTEQLCEKFSHTDWPKHLHRYAKMVNPLLPAIYRANFGHYFWGIDQAEYASDVLFKSRAELEQILPDLVTASMTGFGATDVMRFLGRKPHGNFKGEVVIDHKKRPQGCRVKFSLNRNSAKFYDHLLALRFESTINNPSEFKIRKTTDTGEDCGRWYPMGKGVSNFYRFAQVARAVNSRLIDALAAAPLQGKAVENLDSLCRSKKKRGQTIARLNPVEPRTISLFQAVLSGDFLINGFRNHELQNKLYAAKSYDEQENRKRIHHVSRLIAKLRGHGLIAKVKDSRLYRVTRYGVRAMWAIVRFRLIDFPALSENAITFA